MDVNYLVGLNFKVETIEHFLGIPFEGKTILEMEEYVAAAEAFVKEHWEARLRVTNSLLADAWEDAKKRYNLGEE